MAEANSNFNLDFLPMSKTPPVPYPKSQQEQYSVCGGSEVFNIVNDLYTDFYEEIMKIDTRKTRELTAREFNIAKFYGRIPS